MVLSFEDPIGLVSRRPYLPTAKLERRSSQFREARRDSIVGYHEDRLTEFARCYS